MANKSIHTVKLQAHGGIGGATGGGGVHRFAPSAKPKNAKKTMRRILKLYAKHLALFILSIFLTVISSLIVVAIPYFIGKSFSAFKINPVQLDFALLLFFLRIITLLYVCNWIISTVNGVLMLHLSQKLVFRLRSDFFAKLQKLPLAFFDSRAHGDTMSRLTNDIDTISSTIATATAQLISSILTISGSIIVMCILNIPLTFTVLLCIPAVVLLTKIITKRSREYFIAQQRSLGTLNGIIEENITALKTVKAFLRQEYLCAQFNTENKKLYTASEKAQEWAGAMMPLMNVINNLIFTLIAFVGGLLCTTGGLLVGTVVTFINYAKQVSQPLNAVAGMFNTIQSALAGAERVFEILDLEEEKKDIPNALELKNPTGKVDFKNVCFSYQKNHPVLKNIDFSVPAGEVIALVGETGAGKTTIVNVLMRFYEIDSGSICIDGIDISNASKTSLRSCFSVVLQDSCFFSGTILDNIRYAKPHATKEEIIQAAQLVCAHDFIEKLPNGYETLISGTTENLSLGQRQLLAIVRAVLVNAPILILDEATSSVDTKTEKNIQKALLHLMKNHTCFLIAHRLSTIRNANRILVLENGSIIESGTHSELMEQKGHYYRLVQSQTEKIN